MNEATFGGRNFGKTRASIEQSMNDAVVGNDAHLEVSSEAPMNRAQRRHYQHKQIPRVIRMAVRRAKTRR